jgi:ribose transport system substrate-binding protein
VRNDRHTTPRRGTRFAAGALCALAALGVTACGSSGGGSTATTKSMTVPAKSGALKPFDPDAPAGPATGLPKRVAWANTSSAEFFLALGSAIEQASKAQGCDYVTAVADNDAQKNVDQINQFSARGIGALVIQPLDPAAQAPVMQKAIDKGVGVMGLITSPTTMVAVTDQYAVGLAQGKAAAAYVTAHLGGKAQVHVFNEDSLGPPLVARHKGMLDGLKTGGAGVEVVSDVEAKKLTNEGGFQTMNTVIQAHPDVKVVIGADTEVIGALRALEQSGKQTKDMYLSGINGDQQALDLIKKGGPYRASFGFAWPVLGYAIGSYSCDWIAGKSIPRALVVPAVPLDSAEAIAKYDADMKDAAASFADPATYATYIEPRGNISYATRQDYWKQTYTP